MAVYLNKQTMKVVTNQLRTNKDKVVLTHGAFDIYHIGHDEFLSQSRLLGDYLVVALESDARVSMYKGKKRPIIPQEQRMKVLLNNKNIDFVTFLDEEYDMNDQYYAQLYSLFNPTTVAFGHGYNYAHQFEKYKSSLRGVTPREIVHKYDGFQSTTNIINKINNLN